MYTSFKGAATVQVLTDIGWLPNTLYISGYKKDIIFLKKRVVKGSVHDLNTICPNTNGRKITDIFLKK